MKTLTKHLALVFCIVLIVPISSSCKKRKAERSTITSEDMALAEAGFGDIAKVVEDASKESDLEGNRIVSDILSGCATINVTPAWPDPSFPKTVTIDFGNVNCTDNYGVKRRGQITAVFSGMYRDSATVITITPQNYFINDYKVEGTKTVTNNGKNSSGNTNFTVVVANGKITHPNGDVSTWNSTRNREWVIGENTTFLTNGFTGIFDDEYDITGTGNGTNRAGRNFTANITSPLRAAVVCRWIKKGIVEIQPDGLSLRKVDFGDGTCDNKATVEINGKIYNITMR
jgi:hypothetical protein